MYVHSWPIACTRCSGGSIRVDQLSVLAVAHRCAPDDLRCRDGAAHRVKLAIRMTAAAAANYRMYAESCASRTTLTTAAAVERGHQWQSTALRRAPWPTCVRGCRCSSRGQLVSPSQPLPIAMYGHTPRTHALHSCPTDERRWRATVALVRRVGFFPRLASPRMHACWEGRRPLLSPPVSRRKRKAGSALHSLLPAPEQSHVCPFLRAQMENRRRCDWPPSASVSITDVALEGREASSDCLAAHRTARRGALLYPCGVPWRRDASWRLPTVFFSLPFSFSSRRGGWLGQLWKYKRSLLLCSCMCGEHEVCQHGRA